MIVLHTMFARDSTSQHCSLKKQHLCWRLRTMTALIVYVSLSLSSSLLHLISFSVHVLVVVVAHDA